MDLENFNNYSFRNLAQINVLLGKNGCGKSFILKEADTHLINHDDISQVRYLSPERGGLLTYEAGIDDAIGRDSNWLTNQRRKNQSENFRQQSASIFRRLELLFLRKMEKEIGKFGYESQKFEMVIDQINSLLDRVKLNRHDQKGFEIIERNSGNPAAPANISSGEAELISLGIEILSFAREATPGKTNILLADEPDVHLHPDLQDRLARFIVNVCKDKPVTLIIATHSTPLLAGLSEAESTSVAFMRPRDKEISFRPITNVDRDIMPIFGAHPLSNIFNQAPILLLEGEDDERIWQQAVRSSQGNIQTYPCVAGSIDDLAKYEATVRDIIDSVYDDAQGYSLRDRDDNPEDIDDIGPIIRMRLHCRASENLMLSDNALNLIGFDWLKFQQLILSWVDLNFEHQYFDEVKDFAESGFNRLEHDLKDIRNILIGLMTNKPWEVVVGQAIAQLSIQGGSNDEGSLRFFLGDKVCRTLLKLDPA
jgi:energy-coupling factor transporter ATP-binding protein EcfA2